MIERFTKENFPNHLQNNSVGFFADTTSAERQAALEVQVCGIRFELD